jgi:hypothetical protein
VQVPSKRDSKRSQLMPSQVTIRKRFEKKSTDAKLSYHQKEIQKKSADAKQSPPRI